MSSEHERRHGGVKPPGHDAADWDARYAESERLWSPDPNATIAELLGPLPAGSALDLGAGEGRHAVWLAALGWDVTAVDFSAVGVDRGRREAEARGIEVRWVVADALEWTPPAGTTYDLVLVVYLHVHGDALTRLHEWVAPGGRLVVLGHALRNLTDGVGGPQDPRLLHTEEHMRAAAQGLHVERLGEVLRPTPHGEAVDLLLVARRTDAAAPSGAVG
ncbi:MAG: class I SAM-dependent methyltransferase [Actinomycetota bacterium]|nr:class I SAM-dependent methyltransferase [Actinomycetota bacterium]